jgi:hypothetical protein
VILRARGARARDARCSRLCLQAHGGVLDRLRMYGADRIELG